jgi:hypothetical protein
MYNRLITEEDYREALRRFLEIIDVGNEAVNEEELCGLIALLETYEYENC